MSMASAARQAPNPERWAPAFEGQPLLAAECSGDSINGVVWWRYKHRGLLRGAKYRAKRLLMQIRGPSYRVKGRTRFWIRSDPLFCPWERVRGYVSQLLAKTELEGRSDHALEVEELPGSIVGRSPTRWIAYVATPSELIEVDLYVPGGVGDADARDFESMLASIRPVEGPYAAARRGIWLRWNFAADPTRVAAVTCGMPGAERLALARRELARATQSQPHDWRPWAELGSLLEREAGGEDWIALLVERERSGLPRGGVWVGLSPRDPAGAPDREKLRRAARLYGAAARRSPPARHLRSSEERALDAGSLLAARARCLAKAGDEEAAANAYWRALDEGVEDSWGVLEASLWLAERALRRGEREEARRLYARADRAWRSFYTGSGVGSGWGPPLRSKIDARLRQLE
jgi:hypothetical protein